MTPPQQVAYDNSSQRRHPVDMLPSLTIEKIRSDNNVTEHHVTGSTFLAALPHSSSSSSSNPAITSNGSVMPTHTVSFDDETADKVKSGTSKKREWVGDEAEPDTKKQKTF
jgi:hypothetical protein